MDTIHKTVRKRNESKETKKEKYNKHEIALGKLLKYLSDRFPDSMMDRILLLRDALMIQFKALSFAKLSTEKLEKDGEELIKDIAYELYIYIFDLSSELLEMWEEDKERKAKGDKNEHNM